MKAMTRLLIGIPVAILVIIVAAGLVLGLMIDPNDYRQRIEQTAQEQAGIDLQINGSIDWTLFPWLGLEVSDIALAYPDQPQLAQLDQARLFIRLLPLLGARVEMSDILLDGVELSLLTTAEGNNWTPPASQASAADAAAPQSDSGSAASGTLTDFDIQSVTLSNVRIHYTDQVANSRIEVNDLTLTTGRLVPDSPIPLELSARLQQFQAEKEVLAADLQLSTQAMLDPTAQHYRLDELNGRINLDGSSLGSAPLSLELQAVLDLQLAQQQLELELQKLALANLESQGQISLSNFQQPAIQGSLQVAEFDLKELLRQLGQTVPETADDSALSRISLNTSLQGSADSLRLDPLRLQLDDTGFSGTASFNLQNLAQNITLKGGSLNADRYLPPATADGGESTAATTDSKESGSSTSWSQEEIIPLEPLQALNLDAVLDLEQLQIAGLVLDQPGITVNAHGGLVQLSRINADLYSGTLRNSATLDARQTPLQLATRLNLDGVQIGELLTALNGETPITGALDSQASLQARGQSLHAIINSLNGSARFAASDGVIEGISMAQTLCQGINNLASLGINSEQVDQSTPFATISGSFDIVNGVIRNEDLSAALDALALTGRGSVDLPQTVLDYRLGLTITSNLFNESCSINNRLEGVEFPVNCKGSFDTDPAQLCRPDASAITNLLKAQVQQKAQEKLESSLQEKLEEKLGEEGAGSLLKGLLGN